MLALAVDPQREGERAGVLGHLKRLDRNDLWIGCPCHPQHVAQLAIRELIPAHINVQPVVQRFHHLFGGDPLGRDHVGQAHQVNRAPQFLAGEQQRRIELHPRHNLAPLAPNKPQAGQLVQQGGSQVFGMAAAFRRSPNRWVLQAHQNRVQQPAKRLEHEAHQRAEADKQPAKAADQPDQQLGEHHREIDKTLHSPSYSQSSLV